MNRSFDDIEDFDLWIMGALDIGDTSSKPPFEVVWAKAMDEVQRRFDIGFCLRFQFEAVLSTIMGLIGVAAAWLLPRLLEAAGAAVPLLPFTVR